MSVPRIHVLSVIGCIPHEVLDKMSGALKGFYTSTLLICLVSVLIFISLYFTDLNIFNFIKNDGRGIIDHRVISIKNIISSDEKIYIKVYKFFKEIAAWSMAYHFFWWFITHRLILTTKKSYIYLGLFHLVLITVFVIGCPHFS